MLIGLDQPSYYTTRVRPFFRGKHVWISIAEEMAIKQHHDYQNDYSGRHHNRRHKPVGYDQSSSK